MKQSIKNPRSIVTLAIIGLILTTTSSTLNANAIDQSTIDERRQAMQERQEATRKDIEERKQEIQTRLTEKKLEACQNRQEKISATMQRMAERSTNQVELFTTIADRTKQFYIDKEYALANYDTLVADVDAKKSNAEIAINALSSAGEMFSCETIDPKAFVQSFKTAHQTARDALKEYRTAVKDLIVGVKSAANTTQSSTEQPTEDNQ